MGEGCGGGGGTLNFVCYIGSFAPLIFNPKTPTIFGIPKEIPVNIAIPPKKYQDSILQPTMLIKIRDQIVEFPNIIS